MIPMQNEECRLQNGGSSTAVRFGELEIGARFCFRAHRYEKVAADIGRDEERGGNLLAIHSESVAGTTSATKLTGATFVDACAKLGDAAMRRAMAGYGNRSTSRSAARRWCCWIGW